MALPEPGKLELTPDLEAEIAKISAEQRAWVLANLEKGQQAQGDIDRMRDNTRSLIKIADFFDQLSRARTIDEVNDQLVFRFNHGFDEMVDQFDFQSFPHYREIVTNALLHCLDQAQKLDQPTRQWIGHAIWLKRHLGKAIQFSDADTPGYSDAWKAVFVRAIRTSYKIAIEVANAVHGEVNLHEIPDYDQLIQEQYYHLILHCHHREDRDLRLTLGDGVDFSEEESKVVEAMNGYLNNLNSINLIQIKYLLEKYGEDIHFGPDNIENFECQVKAAFLLSLKELSIAATVRIKAVLGPEINFDDQIRQAFVSNLEKFNGEDDACIRDASSVKKHFGQEIDFSKDPACEHAVVELCTKLLEEDRWQLYIFFRLKETLGAGMDFSDRVVPRYSEVVKEVFLTQLSNGRIDELNLIKDKLGAEIDLSPDKLVDYQEAAKTGFVRVLSNPQHAKSFLDQFGAQISQEERKAILHESFISQIQSGDWRQAIDLKKHFESEVSFERNNFPGYDDIFRHCLIREFQRCLESEVTGPQYLYRALGAGVDITDVLKIVIKKSPRKFILFAQKEHWRAIFGDELVNKFLAVLPKGTDEKRNAFTHNPYDRTSSFIEALAKNPEFELTSEEVERLTEFVELFGLTRSQNLYIYFRELKSHELGQGMLGPELSEAGISSVSDLEKRVHALRAKIYGQEEVFEFGKLSRVEMELLSVATGKSTHRFDNNRESVATIVKDFERDHKAGKIAAIPAGYQVESIEASEISIDFDPESVRSDFTLLSQELLKSINAPDDHEPLVKKSLSIIRERIEQLEGKGVNPQIDKLKALQLEVEAAKDLDTLMIAVLKTTFLGKRNPFSSIIREIIFRKIFVKTNSPEAVADMASRISQPEINGQAVLELIGIFDNTIKHHVLNLNSKNKEAYWSDRAWAAIKAAKKDGRLLDPVRAFSPHITNLKQAASNFKVNDTGHKSTIRAVPDRGFVGEMSAYLADVCYSAEYPLLRDRPNLIPHKLISGEDMEAEFFGSYLLFELESDRGEKVMLVRGFNVPKEASIDIEKFIETTFDRLALTAHRRGIKKVIIPGLMGALSNYPMTLNYLSKKYINDQEPISLSEEFGFNGYDLTDNCYVVRDLSDLPKTANS